MRKVYTERSRSGFTLIELLMSMAIIGVLSTFGYIAYNGAQVKARDAERKSDLRQISEALELYFADYDRYPDSENGNILGCPLPAGACTWGSGEFSDGSTTYFKALPQDSRSSAGFSYYYRVHGTSNQKYQIFARLENQNDKDCINGNCVDPVSYQCGSAFCNFAITSSNTTPLE